MPKSESEKNKSESKAKSESKSKAKSDVSSDDDFESEFASSDTTELTVDLETDETDATTNKQKSWRRLDKFLKQYKVVGKDVPHTNTQMDAPYGKYNIPEDEYKEFLRLYRKALKDGHVPSFTERHKEYGPLLIDFEI